MGPFYLKAELLLVSCLLLALAAVLACFLQLCSLVSKTKPLHAVGADGFI